MSYSTREVRSGIPGGRPLLKLARLLVQLRIQQIGTGSSPSTSCSAFITYRTSMADGTEMAKSIDGEEPKINGISEPEVCCS